MAAHAFLTDLDYTSVEVNKFHRHHALVGHTIRDLKEDVGREHVPSGNFHANSVWLQCAALGHNLIRWTGICGNVRVDNQLIVACTIRTRLLTIPRPDRQPRRTTTQAPDRLALRQTVHHRVRHAPHPEARASHPPAPTTQPARPLASPRRNAEIDELGYAEPVQHRTHPTPRARSVDRGLAVDHPLRPRGIDRVLKPDDGVRSSLWFAAR